MRRRLVLFVVAACSIQQLFAEEQKTIPPAKSEVAEKVWAAPLSEADWLKRSSHQVKQPSEMMPGPEMTARVRRGGVFTGSVYAYDAAEFTNQFGRKGNGFVFGHLLKGPGDSAVLLQLRAEDGHIDDPRLLARLQERGCAIEGSTGQDYAKMRLLIAAKQYVFDDERDRTAPMPRSSCQFRIRGRVYRGGNFYGIRHVVEVDEKR